MILVRASIIVGTALFTCIGGGFDLKAIALADPVLLDSGTVSKTREARRMGLDHRRRDKSGEIRHKSGNTRVDSLRKTYGPSFAKGLRADMHLHTLL